MDVITKAINGDNRAFSELYQMYRQEIFSFLLGRIRDREDAAGLVYLNPYYGKTMIVDSYKINSDK